MGMRVWGSANYPYNPGAGYVLKLLSRAPHEPSASADVSQFKKSYRRAGGHTGRQAGRRHAVDKTAISRAARHRAASGNWVSGMIFSHGWCLSMVAPPALSTSSLSSPPTPALPFARHLLPTPPVNFEQDKYFSLFLPLPKFSPFRFFNSLLLRKHHHICGGPSLRLLPLVIRPPAASAGGDSS